MSFELRPATVVYMVGYIQSVHQVLQRYEMQALEGCCDEALCQLSYFLAHPRNSKIVPMKVVC